MSKKLITDSFPVKKRTEPITQKFAQSKAKNERIKTTDEEKIEYKDAKDVRDMNILRDFDMRCEYGPCIGITRFERWKRAEEYSLDPPQEVKEIIEQHPNDIKYTECIWHDEELI